jgi:hypothetical protein
MNGALLIAGSGAELIAALSTETEKHGMAAACAVIPKRNVQNRGSYDTMDKKPLMFDWNPGSAISARSLVLSVENRLGIIGAGIIVCSAPRTAENDFSPAGIDFLVDNHIKSYMFLAHDLMRYFHTTQSGTLALVMLEEVNTNLLTAPISSAFSSFAGSLSAYQGEYMRIMSFSCEEKPPAPVNDFAKYILKTIAKNEKPGGGRRFKFTRLKHNLNLS